MFVRLTTIHGAKGQVDAAIEFVEQSGRPALEAAAGSRGVTTFVDRDAGATAVASYWDTADSMRASETALADRRAQAGAVGGGDITIESYEVAIANRVQAPTAGAIIRLLRVAGEPAQLDATIAFYRDHALPAMLEFDGLLGVQLLVDRESGRAISATAWSDDAAVERAQGDLRKLVAKFEEQFGAGVTGIESYTLLGTTLQLP